MTKNLCLLSLALLGYGCNEQISPALNSGSSTTVPPTVTIPTTYYFELKNTSPTVLNYVLHRTGDGNHSSSCRISSTTAFSGEIFRADVTNNPFANRTYDIACFFEAEELVLFFNGIDYQIEASMNTCDYIAYTPYSYFDAIPGSSFVTFKGIVCGEDAQSPNPGDVTAHATVNNLVYGAVPTPIGCNQMLDMSTPVALRKPIAVDADGSSLCKYDYASNGGGNGQNCDDGAIEYDLTEIYDSDTDTLVYNLAKEPFSKSRYDCGGSIAACVEGAIRQEASFENATFGNLIYTTESNTEFKQGFGLPSLLGKRGANYDIVNYRKGLASLNLDYKDYRQTSDTYWGDSTNRTSYDPALIERYSNRRNPDSTTIITYSQATTVGQTIHGYTVTPLAAEPFMGIASKVSPFYNFLCLDRAFEVKARIRMIVRDWDKVFPTDTSSMSLISDVFEAVANRRQDLPNDEEEVPNDGGIYMYFNDKDDWDNLIPMRRWRQDDTLFPYPQGAYSNGSGIVWEPDYSTLLPAPTSPWFDYRFFPNQGPAN